MAPVEDDPDMLAAILRLLKSLLEGLSFITPWLLPAFFGALAGSRGKDRRKHGFWGWVNAVFWATIAGAGLAPLAAHFSGAPEAMTNSVAFLIGLLGYDRTNHIRAMLRARKILKENEDDGDRNEGGDV